MIQITPRRKHDKIGELTMADIMVWFHRLHLTVWFAGLFSYYRVIKETIDMTALLTNERNARHQHISSSLSGFLLFHVGDQVGLVPIVWRATKLLHCIVSCHFMFECDKERVKSEFCLSSTTFWPPFFVDRFLAPVCCHFCWHAECKLQWVFWFAKLAMRPPLVCLNILNSANPFMCV